ncbi:hypothetical protein [Novosphingobium sp. Gsoil 351]|uniref:hypothetical protein n=1 Tax=Novosphingobium sp. Gsoil 351 TaxID=2675225 RepID=UPI0018A817D2|nr:hypothetical protein [Novosphingobium sp. Gsoil 351]
MPQTFRGKVVFAAVLCLLATGCFLLPGKFASELTVKRDGTFAFSYKGDIHVLALSKLAQDELDDKATFKPQPQCKDDGEPVDNCSYDTEDVQRQNWESSQQAAKDKKRQDAEMARQMLGGIDPADPRAAEELAERMRKQAGWRSVQYVGDGKYVVDFAIAGRLDHDFSFPSLERVPLITPFVAIYRRTDGTVRIDAPAFSAGANGGPMGAMMQGMTGDKTGPQGMPELDGAFAVATDGEILANNTDDGPQTGVAGMRRLAWKVNPRTAAAPTALIKLGK